MKLGGFLFRSERFCSDRNVSVSFWPIFRGLAARDVKIGWAMAHRNANRPERAAGGGRGDAQLHVVKHVAADGEGSGTRVARGRRPACGPDAESTGGFEDDGPYPRRGAARHAALDREALEILIVQQWTKTLRGPYDWGDWPLARYTLGEGVLSAAERYAGAAARCTDSGVERLAWVCAMIACGRAPRLRSIEARPRCAEDARDLRDAEDAPRARGADDVQLIRADGALAWCCNLERETIDGPQLHYWVHPSGSIEFETVCGNDW
jgi:hypothetical protein